MFRGLNEDPASPARGERDAERLCLDVRCRGVQSSLNQAGEERVRAGRTRVVLGCA